MGLEVVLADADNVFTRDRGLLVQVRRGQLTIPTLDRLEGLVRHLHATWKAPVGFVAVLEPTAETVSNEVRARQRQIVREADRADVRMALLVVGDGLHAKLSRTIARALMIATPRMKCVGDVEAAARWVAAHIEMATREVVALVQESRRLGLPHGGSSFPSAREST